jgi:hypothetical protein
MIDIFNQMYLEVWEKTREKINWDAAQVSKRIADGQEVDISELLLRVLEAVVTAARDGAILAIHYNNEKILEDLRTIGIELPERGGGGGEEE